MSYLVLARKFRPQTFASIVGQEHITRALANAILWNRVPHALLFTGPRGVGKTTSARVFARALNCTGRKFPESGSVAADADASLLVEPCGECSNCKEIAKSSSIAVWEIDGASNNSVDNVRDLIDSLRSLPPPGSQYKIYIIDEVHMLSTAAFNALLKSLEEPPPNTIFIFATTEPQKIPETVISRCQRHDFRRISVDVIVDALAELARAEKVTAEKEVLEFIAIKSRGGMRDAQTMLDRLISFCGDQLELSLAQQLFGFVDGAFFFRLSEAVLNEDPETCFSLLDEAFGQSLDVRAFAADFLGHFRNLLLLSLSQRSGKLPEAKLMQMLEVTKTDFLNLAKQARAAESFNLQRLFDIANETTESAMRSSFPKFVFEAGVAKMAVMPSLRPLADLISAVESGTPPAVRSATSSRPAASPAARPAVPQSAVPLSAVPQPAAASSAPAEAPANVVGALEEFNPSWQDFINYVRTSRAEVLAAILRRVSPVTFGDGKLVIEAGAFDIELMKDTQTFTNLKNLLQGYSSQDNWEIRFSVHKPVIQPHAPEAKRAPQISREKRSSSSATPGSMIAIEQEAQRKQAVVVDGEARNDPLVKAALSMFEGSTIEKVSVLKE